MNVQEAILVFLSKGRRVDFTSTDEIDLCSGGCDSSIDLSNQEAVTTEFWANFDDTAVDRMNFMQSQGVDSWNIGMGTYDTDFVNNNIKFLHRDDDGAARDTIQTPHPGSGSWHYFVGTYNNSTSDYKALYVDGQEKASTTVGISNLRAGPGTSMTIGHGGDFGPFDGKMDEFRITRGLARSAAWISTSYNNMSLPSLFMIFWPQEPYGG